MEVSVAAIAGGLRVPDVAAIAVHDFGKSPHVGIAYSADGTSKLLHLANHCDLEQSAWEAVVDSAYRIIRLKFDQTVQDQLAARCREIWRKRDQNQIPYGFSRTAYFAVDGTLQAAPDFVGLTCATFVLVIFESCFVSLVDHETWPAEAADAAWQHAVVEQLARRLGNDSDHVRQLRSLVGAPRYHPFDVAAAAALAPPSQPRAKIGETAIQIRREDGQGRSNL